MWAKCAVMNMWCFNWFIVAYLVLAVFFFSLWLCLLLCGQSSLIVSCIDMLYLSLSFSGCDWLCRNSPAEGFFFNKITRKSKKQGWQQQRCGFCFFRRVIVYLKKFLIDQKHKAWSEEYFSSGNLLSAFIVGLKMLDYDSNQGTPFISI